MKKHIIILVFLISTSLNLAAQANIYVSGTVKDAKGEALIGVSITIKDVPGMGTVTDLDGHYKLKMEPYHTLVFTYIGYETKEVLVKDQHTVNIIMKEAAANALNEVVVTGMGTQKKLTVTGAVTNVDIAQLKQYSTSNLSNALAGNVPGIIAMQTSGQPGQNTSEFWVRGISTFGANSSAYILVDGAERNSIDDINIEDIASFTVLKDASATAIYGSKGANGVILITTKHGQAGKVNISAKIESSYNARTITPKFVDGITYANLINEANVTRNKGVVYQPEELALIRSGLDPDIYPNVDWEKVILKPGAGSYRANINMSGGGSTARYYISIAYTDDQGMFKTDRILRKDYDTNADAKRWNYRVNTDVNLTKTTLVSVGVSGSLQMQNSPGLGNAANGNYNLWGELFGYNALLTPVVYSNGYIPAMGTGDPNNPTVMMNPWVESTQTGYNEIWINNIQTNINLDQNLDFITKGLHFVGRFGYNTDNQNEIDRHRWPELWKALNRNSTTGQINWQHLKDASDMVQTSGSIGDRYDFVDLLLSWDHSFAKLHNTGVTMRYTQDERMNSNAQNIGSDIRNGVAKRNEGLAGRFTYNYALRYFFDFNFGYTGSENFAPGHRWGFFPAFSGAWNIGEEKFVKKHIKWIDLFKIRYSHGKVGNDNLGDNNRFPYLYTISGSTTGYNWGTSDYTHWFGGTHYTQMASPYVTWEIATKNDLGTDISFFDGHFSATLDYFSEKRTGIYMVRNFLPEITGLESAPSANVGSVSLKGFDGNFAFKEKVGMVGVTFRGNMTYSKNKVLNEDEENQVYAYQYLSGYRVNQQRGLIALGLFKDYDDIRNSPKQQFGVVQPGDIKYKDINGDGVVDRNDQVAIGATSTPSLIYGLGASVTWNGFDFNFQFQGAGKSTFPIMGKCVWAFSANQWGNIYQGLVDNRWISRDISGTAATENPNASYPRLSYGGDNNNQQTSTFWMRDGRYIRLKNLDIGYTLPKILTNKMHLTSLRLYVTGTNLLTWSPFKLWDPEQGPSNAYGENYPLVKSFTIGMTLNL
jgi:TonB-linked SusC/RagA family outer membrane protein